MTGYRLTIDERLFATLLNVILTGREERISLYAWNQELFPENPHLVSFTRTKQDLLVRKVCRIRSRERMSYEEEGMDPAGAASLNPQVLDWTLFPETLQEPARALSGKFAYGQAEKFLADVLGTHAFRIRNGELTEIRMACKEGFLLIRKTESGREDEETHNRTILWTGLKRFARIRAAVLGCIGAGGLMNPFILSAMHHGFRKFVIIDDDRLDAGNLNRFLGGRRAQIGSYKAELLKRMILDFDPDAEVTALTGKFPYGATEQALAGCDILACGVDNDFTRLNAQLYALAFSKPLFDMGSGIYLIDNASLDPEVDEAGGQLRVFVPSGPCLACMGLDREALADFHRQELDRARGYVIGTDLTPPSVITLNWTIASVCLKMVVDFLTGKRLTAFHVKYSEKELALFRIADLKNPACPVCGSVSQD